jgi:hypothetical protein
MTTQTADLLELLRGRRETRPPVDRSLAGGLRAWLEDDLAPLVGARSRSEPLFLTPRSITAEALSTVPPLQVLARSALVSALASSQALGLEVAHPMDDALSALEADPSRHELIEAVHALEPEAFAQLAAEVAAHHATLSVALPPVPASWLPRTNVRLSSPLAGGRLVLGAVASVVLGPPAAERASVCLLEVSTSELDERAGPRLGVLALIETLRAGAAPLRVAALSTSSGRSVVLDVDDELLIEARSQVVTAAGKRVAP